MNISASRAERRSQIGCESAAEHNGSEYQICVRQSRFDSKRPTAVRQGTMTQGARVYD